MTTKKRPVTALIAVVLFLIGIFLLDQIIKPTS